MVRAEDSGEQLAATLMSLWGWVSEGSRTSPGEALWDGAGPGGRWGWGWGLAPPGRVGVGLSCCEPFPFLLSQLRLGQSPKPEKHCPFQPQFLYL